MCSNSSERVGVRCIFHQQHQKQQFVELSNQCFFSKFEEPPLFDGANTLALYIYIYLRFYVMCCTAKSFDNVTEKYTEYLQRQNIEIITITNHIWNVQCICFFNRSMLISNIQWIFSTNQNEDVSIKNAWNVFFNNWIEF